MSVAVAVPAATPRWWNAAIGACGLLVTAGVVAGTVYGGFVEAASTRRAVAGVLALLAVAVLAVRNRHPVRVLVAELILAGVIDIMVGRTDLAGAARFVVVIAVYAAGVRTDARRSVAVGGGAWAVLAVTGLIGHRAVGGVVSDLVLLTAVTAVAFTVRSHRALLESYRERAEQAEREQVWQTNRAVGAERVRIARELHDVVAHHVSLLVVQAGAVRETLPAGHPTRPVLDSMIDGGRHAMSELRDMLDALRLVGPQVPSLLPASRVPQPNVAQIPELVEGSRAAGLDVVLDVEGIPGLLPPATSLAAYRIVQESLTNVVKHASASVVRVRLVYAGDELMVSVTNTPTSLAGLPAWPGSDRVGAPVSGGLGLTGMAERAALGHGRLEAGPCPEGWRVRARFPLGLSW